jgi:hypothetical protein
VAGFLRAQDENRALCFFDDFFGDGAEGNSAPAGHAVRGDDDHICVFAARDSHDFHSDVVGGADLCADFDVFRREAGGEIRKALFRSAMKALIVFAFLQNRDAAGQIGNRRDDIDENQLGAEARGEIGGNVEGIV